MSEEEAQRITELAVFRWYSMCSCEHDRLSEYGLEMMHRAFVAVLQEDPPNDPE